MRSFKQRNAFEKVPWTSGSKADLEGGVLQAER